MEETMNNGTEVKTELSDFGLVDEETTSGPSKGFVVLALTLVGSAVAAGAIAFMKHKNKKKFTKCEEVTHKEPEDEERVVDDGVDEVKNSDEE